MTNFNIDGDLDVGGVVGGNEEDFSDENCFICWRKCHHDLEPLFKNNQRSDRHQVNKDFKPLRSTITSTPLKCQLAVIFLLRRVLGIHSNVIAEILERAEGVNPSDWGFRLCPSCHVLFREAEFIHRRLLRFQTDFEELAKEIRELVVLSAKENRGEVSCNLGDGNKRGKRRKPGRPPRGKELEENASLEAIVNETGKSKMTEKIRSIFLDAWESGKELDMTPPQVLFTTKGTHSELDGVHTTQPIQVKIIQNPYLASGDKTVRLSKTTTTISCRKVGISPAATYFVPEEANLNEIFADGEIVLNGEVAPSQISIKREAPEQDNDILIDAEGDDCYFENDGFQDTPSPIPEAGDNEDGLVNEVNVPANPTKSTTEVRTKRAKRKFRDNSSDSEDYNGDDKDSDYQPNAAAPGPKKDKRFTRKKPNVKENMRKKQLRTLKAASFDKVAVGTNVEPIAVKGENGACFACPQEGCGLAFKGKLDCHVHVLRDHYDDPLPYHCHVCDSKRFGVEMILRKHMVRFHRGAKTPYDQDYDPEQHSAEKLISVVEADQIWNSFLNDSKADGARDSEHSSDDEGVPGIPSFPDEVLEKFRNDKDGKEFRCRHSPCKRKFGNEMLRDGHEKRIHLGIEKPFQCEHCKKDFIRRTKLLAHMAVAHYSNQYSCDHCGSRFADKVLLAGHIGRAHLGEKHPFKCTSCPRRFARRTKMDMHMYKLHGIPLPTNPPKRKIPARAIPVPKIIPNKAKKVLDGEQEGMEPKKCWICHTAEGKPTLFDTGCCWRI